MVNVPRFLGPLATIGEVALIGVFAFGLHLGAVILWAFAYFIPAMKKKGYSEVTLGVALELSAVFGWKIQKVPLAEDFVLIPNCKRDATSLLAFYRAHPELVTG